MAAFFITVGILFCLSLILFVPMRFGVRYEKTAAANKFHIYVSVFGILIRIPIHNKKDASAKKRHTKAPEPAENETVLSFDTFKKRIEVFREVAERQKDDLKSMLSYVRKHLSCNEIDFNICFGLDDAAKTGIATGAVWTSGTLLLKTIDTFIGIKKIGMHVYPDFNQKKFEIYVKAILIMRPIHFIIIGKKLADTIQYIKSKIN